MKYLFVSIMTFLLLLACSSESENYSQVSTTAIKERNEQQVVKSEDLLTLELTFGSEEYGTKDEYLLVSPGSINITDEGDILISDEVKIKVYDKYGKGEKIIGRRGLGPGEFSTSPGIRISPNGYLTAFDSSNRSYSIFSPDYKFIEKRNIRYSPRLENYFNDQGLDPKFIKSMTNIISLDSSTKLFAIWWQNGNVAYIFVMYEDDNIVVPLIHDKKPRYVNLTIAHSLNRSKLCWGLLPDRRVLYINSNDDKYNEKTGWEYTIHILSLDSLEDKKVMRHFEPVPYSESILKGNVENMGKGLESIDKDKKFAKKFIEERKKLEKVLRERKYWQAVQSVEFDRNYIFIYLKNEDEKGNKLIEVYDADADMFVSSFYCTPDFYESNLIKNGYLYNFDFDKEGFTVVKKYKIQPSVYGK